MTFVYFWLVCGLLGFAIDAINTWFKGQDTTLSTFTEKFFVYVLLGPISLAAELVSIVGCLIKPYKKNVVIRGRKK